MPPADHGRVGGEFGIEAVALSGRKNRLMSILLSDFNLFYIIICAGEELVKKRFCIFAPVMPSGQSLTTMTSITCGRPWRYLNCIL